MHGIVYLITNTENDKKYVGQTVRTLKRRWQRHVNEALRGSQQKLQRAIRKYGLDVFIVENIHFCESKEEMDFVEIFYISLFDTKDSGYNATDGGEGSKGAKHSEESKDKIRKAHIGKKMPPFSEEARRNIGLASKGHKVSDETKRKSGETLRRGYANGRLRGFKDPSTGRFAKNFSNSLATQRVRRVIGPESQ